jgi:hypothetical protein
MCAILIYLYYGPVIYAKPVSYYFHRIHNPFSTLLSNTNVIADVILHTHASPEYLAHREGIKKESACGKCIEMEMQLKEALIALNSAQLIIEILQKGSNMSTIPEHVFIYLFSSVLLHTQHWTCPIMYYKITCT